MASVKNSPADLREDMCRKAEAVSTQVEEAPDLSAARQIVLKLIEEEAAGIPGGEVYVYADPAGDGGADSPQAVFFRFLEDSARERGWRMLDTPRISPLPQITAAVSFADLGIAETGGCVFNNGAEGSHLAVMLASRHIVILPVQSIVPGLDEAGKAISAALAAGSGAPAMSAMITGCSRTSDIERVLTLGAHGPLSMHLVLVESV